jgi:hypothetical protein
LPDSSVKKEDAVICADTIRKEDKAFSNYLRQELEGEIHGLLPDIREIFNTISHLRKQVFSVDEFKLFYSDRLKNSLVSTQDPDFVLKVLFHFSVIGNRPRQKMVEVFRFKDKEAQFNTGENVIVHRGLFKSLQLL